MKKTGARYLSGPFINGPAVQKCVEDFESNIKGRPGVYGGHLIFFCEEKEHLTPHLKKRSKILNA